MTFLFKNKTVSDIEINELGITLPAGEVYNLRDDYTESDELETHILSGDVVFVTTEQQELTPSQSQKVVADSKLPVYEVFYTREEMNSLMEQAEQYTDNAISSLADTSPETLDTLNEIAAALGDDPNFATTMTNELAGKAPLAHDHYGDHYQKGEVDTLLAGKANTNHNHDGVYAPVSHTHNYAPAVHTHHDLYYQKAEVDALVGGGGSGFGEDFAFIKDASIETTTGTTWIKKVTLSVTLATAGTFRIGWSYQWNHDNNKYDFMGRILHNNSTELSHVRLEPKEVGGTFGSTGTDQRNAVSGFDILSLSAGTHTFDIEYRSSFATAPASIWDARLEFWRVANV